MGGTAAAPCKQSLGVFGDVGWKVGGGQPWGWGGCGSGECEAAIPTQPACVDLELISPRTGCVCVCWGRAMKAIALNKTMLPQCFPPPFRSKVKL